MRSIMLWAEREPFHEYSRNAGYMLPRGLLAYSVARIATTSHEWAAVASGNVAA
jgi:hypothetical protein